MFCPKCGKPTEDGQLLCPECLAAQAPAPQAPVEQVPVEPAPQYTPPVQQAPQYAPPVQQAPQESFNLNFGGNPAPQSAKAPKVKKLLFGKLSMGAAIGGGIALIAVITLVIGFVFGGWWGYVSDFFARTFQKPEAYKNTVESAALTSEESNSEIALVKRSLTSAYGAYIEMLGGNGAVDMSVRAELGTELTKLLENAMASQGNAAATTGVAEVLKALQKAEITLNSKTDGDLSQTDLGVNLNGQALAGARLIYDALSGKLYAGITEPAGLNDQFVYVDLEELMMQAGATMPDEETMAVMAALAQQLPSEEEFSAMLDAFILAAMGEITEVEKSNEKLEAGGVSQSFTVLTYDISEQTAMDVVVALMEEASANDTFKKFVEAICNTAAEMGGMEMSADDIIAQISAMADSFEDTGYEPSTETVITIKTYVDKKGDIQGRTFDLEEAVGEKAEITYVTTASGSKQGFLLEVVGEDGTMATLEGSGTKKSGAVTGTYALEAMGEELLILELQNFNSVTMTGTIKVKPGEMIVQEIEGSVPVSALIDLSKIALELTLGDGSFDLAVTMNDKLLVSAGMTLKAGAASGSISVPANAVDANDTAALEAWAKKFEESGEEVIMNQLEKVGLRDLFEMLIYGTAQKQEAVVRPGAVAAPNQNEDILVSVVPGR